MHMAGHYQEADDLLVDTHGADVIDPDSNAPRSNVNGARRMPDPAGTRFQYSATR